MLLVLLIPALLYVFSVQELLLGKLENQEVLVSSTWDLTAQDYRHRGAAPIVSDTQVLNRRTYADHTSAWNDYDEPHPEAKARLADAQRHRARQAHPCWFAEGVKPLTCRLDPNVGSARDLDGRFTLLTEHHGGQSAECSAALAVHDASLPITFMQWWARQRVRSESEALIFPEERLSLVVDAWALGWLKEREGTPAVGHHDDTLLDPASHPESERSEFASWVKVAYGTHQRTQPAVDFLQGLIDDGFLSKAALEDGASDDLATPPIAFTVEPGKTFGGFHPSGHADPRVQQTRRQPAYLGLPDSHW